MAQLRGLPAMVAVLCGWLASNGSPGHPRQPPPPAPPPPPPPLAENPGSSPLAYWMFDGIIFLKNFLDQAGNKVDIL